MGSEYQYAGLRNPRSPGLPVEVCSARLHRLAHAESRLMFLEAAHVISTPGRDAKALLSRCQYEDGQHADRLRRRLTELRVSRRRAFEEPDPDLDLLFDEAMHSRGTAELLAVLALVVKPAMVEAYRRYQRETNGLADYGSLRALREIVAEEEEGLALLSAAYADAVGSSARSRALAEEWAAHLRQLLEAAGGIDGSGGKQPEALRNIRGRSPYRIPRQQAWDDTFPKVWDIEHVGEEEVPPRLAQMICTRLGELTIAEALSFVLCETPGQPWQFYVDVSRHMWDEMRHSLFGEAAIEDLLGDRAALPLREWETEYLYQLEPLPLYAMLCDVESGLMKYPARQALRVRVLPRPGAPPADDDPAGLRLGRRGAARPHRPPPAQVLVPRLAEGAGRPGRRRHRGPRPRPARSIRQHPCPTSGPPSLKGSDRENCDDCHRERAGRVLPRARLPRDRGNHHA